MLMATRRQLQAFPSEMLGTRERAARARADGLLGVARLTASLLESGRALRSAARLAALRRCSAGHFERCIRTIVNG